MIEITIPLIWFTKYVLFQSCIGVINLCMISMMYIAWKSTFDKVDKYLIMILAFALMFWIDCSFVWLLYPDIWALITNWLPQISIKIS